MAYGKLAIEAKCLCKDYLINRSLGQVMRHPFKRIRRFRALDDVSFQVEYGQIMGVIGLNGAGKTTLLKLLCDLLMPTSGKIMVAGYALPEAGTQVRSLIGYVPSDERSFFWRLSGRENLEFFAALQYIPLHKARRRIDELLEAFGMTGKAGGHFMDYSSGIRKRLAIIRGLLHEPRILLMDEPTNSLDPYWDQCLRKYMCDWVHAAAGRAVLWSTHRMEELAEVCDSVLRLDNGRLVSHCNVEISDCSSKVDLLKVMG